MKIEPQKNLRHKGTEIAISVVARHCDNRERSYRRPACSKQSLWQAGRVIGIASGCKATPRNDMVCGIATHSFGMLAMKNQDSVSPIPRFPDTPTPPFPVSPFPRYPHSPSPRFPQRGSILLLVLLIFMILIALVAVVITGILSRQQSSLKYYNKQKTLYLAQSANAMARTSLRDEEHAAQWQDLEALKLDEGIINAKIIQLDNHLWQIETAARDNSRTSIASISNIVRPEFDYALFTTGTLTGNGDGNLNVLGDVHSYKYSINPSFHYNQISGTAFTTSLHAGSPGTQTEDLPFPTLDINYYRNLTNLPGITVYQTKGPLSLTGSKNKPLVVKGIYIATKDIKLENAKVQGALISLEGNIHVGEQCSIDSYYNFPAMASFNGSITLETKNTLSTFTGLIYAVKFILNGSAEIAGAIFSQEQIIFQNNLLADAVITIHFNEIVLQTKGFHFKWHHLKNLNKRGASL